MEVMGVFSSWVTALRKLSWRSFRRISRTMKIVLTTRPAMITPKKIIPKTSGTTCRQWNTIHVMFRKTASATRQAPSVMKNAMAFVRLVMRIAPSLIHPRGAPHYDGMALGSISNGGGHQGFLFDHRIGCDKPVGYKVG